MNEDSDALPTVGQYRGVPLHAFQDTARLAVVRTDIDAVCDTADIERLIQIAGDASRAPEARLLAAYKIEAGWEAAVADRKERPDIDLDRVRASVAGLSSRRWADPDRHCSLLDSDNLAAAVRDEPLA